MGIYLEQEIFDDMSNNRMLKIKAGVREIFRAKWKPVVLIGCVIMSVFVWNKRYDIISVNEAFQFAGAVRYIVNAVVLLLLALALLFVLSILGTPPERRKIHTNLFRIGFVNRAKEIPFLLIKYKVKGQDIHKMEFKNVGIPIEEWERRCSELQSIMNCHIVKIEYGKDISHVILHTVSAKRKVRQKLYWNDDYLSKESFVLVLGKSMFGNETINLSKIPHILLGGSTGSGKTVLLKSLLMQCIKKEASVYIADFKGGVDYPAEWHNHCKMIFDIEELLKVLERIVDILEERKMLFREMGCPNIDSYNEKVIAEESIRRIIFACDEIAEILDKTGLEKADKELVSKIESKLSVIARQGRAFGIHLIMATQRPDANILSGQIKSNIDCRICGKADKVLSQIVLDNTDAAEKIAKDVQGEFITNTGVIFQGYLLNEGGIF